VDPWTLSNFRRLLKKANEFLKSLEPMEKLLSVQDGFSFSRVEALCLPIFFFQFWALYIKLSKTKSLTYFSAIYNVI
jgi:hypothetical protein